jgi:hypothetical protein
VASHSRPIQDTLFPVLAEPAENWCWVVLYSVNDVDEGWTSWRSDWLLPSHFRSATGAEMRLKERTDAEKRKIELNLLQFKLEEKYIGYVPSEDEAWIAN